MNDPKRKIDEIDGAGTFDGGVIEFPDEYTGTMRRYDKNGVCVETRELGVDGTEERMEWEEWAEIFEVQADCYEGDED